MSLSERTKRRQVKAKVDEHMEFCRQLNSNNENSSSCSTLATIQIPLEQDIPESDQHHDCTFISTETQCAGLVPQSDCLHGNNESRTHTSSVGRALRRIKLLPVTHVLVDTWMLTVKPIYKLLNVSDDLKWTTNTHMTPFPLTFKA